MYASEISSLIKGRKFTLAPWRRSFSLIATFYALRHSRSILYLLCAHHNEIRSAFLVYDFLQLIEIIIQKIIRLGFAKSRIKFKKSNCNFMTIPLGYYKLDNPRVINDEELIEFTVELGTSFSIPAETWLYVALDGTMTTP